MTVTKVGATVEANTTSLSTSMSVPAHTTGDVIACRVAYNLTSTPSAAYNDSIAGLSVGASGNFTNGTGTYGMQRLWYAFDDTNSITSIVPTRASGAGNMTCTLKVLRGVSRSTPLTVGTVATYNNVTAINGTFGAVPAGALAEFLSALNASHNANSPTSTWTDDPGSGLQAHALLKSFSTGSTPGTVGYTATTSKYGSGIPVIWNPSTGTTNTLITVGSILDLGTWAPYGTADPILALDDLDNTGTGLAVSAAGQTMRFQGDPCVVPTGVNGWPFTFYLTSDFVGSAWLFELMEGAVSRASISHVVTGTTPEVFSSGFTAAQCAAITAPSTYWPGGPVMRITSP